MGREWPSVCAWADKRLTRWRMSLEPNEAGMKPHASGRRLTGSVYSSLLPFRFWKKRLPSLAAVICYPFNCDLLRSFIIRCYATRWLVAERNSSAKYGTSTNMNKNNTNTTIIQKQVHWSHSYSLTTRLIQSPTHEQNSYK